MKKTYTPRLIVAAIAFSMGLAVNAYAMPRGEHPGPGMGMSGHHEMYHGRAMTRLHDDLKLDAQQESAWKDAEAFAKETMDGMHERFRKHHEEMRNALNQPNADLHDLAKRMDDFRAESQKLRTAVRDRWLAVYDKLNPEQKEKARVFFKSGMERMDQMHERMQNRMHERGRGQPAQPQGAPKN